MRTLTGFFLFVLVVALVGCGAKSDQPAFPDLNPVKGVVKQDGRPVKGGAVQFVPDPANPEFMVNSAVGDDGTFALTTVRSTDKKGERKPGAPAGKYKVTYSAPNADQTSGATGPIDLPPVTVTAGANDVTLELPKK